MSRTMLLVFLLLILIITSQFEWKQPLVAEVDTSTGISEKQQLSSNREEAVKEKIILSQEKSIRRLNELVRGLHEQLSQCRGGAATAYKTTALLTDHLSHVEHRVLED